MFVDRSKVEAEKEREEAERKEAQRAERLAVLEEKARLRQQQQHKQQHMPTAPRRVSDALGKAGGTTLRGHNGSVC